MRKVCILMLSLLLTLGMAGCGFSPQQSAPLEADGEEQEVEVSTPTEVEEVVEEEPGIAVPTPVEEIGIEAVGEATPPEIIGYVIPNEFAPDWDANVRRGGELADFMQVGLSRADVERELGMPPTGRVYAGYDGRPWYRYDLMTAPGYEFTDTHDNIDLAGLRAGHVGVIVFVYYDSQGNVYMYSIRYAGLEGIGQAGTFGGRGTTPWHYLPE